MANGESATDRPLKGGRASAQLLWGHFDCAHPPLAQRRQVAGARSGLGWSSPHAPGQPGAGRRVVLVGTYPPTPCGLATFTSNLRAAIEAPGWGADVVRLVEGPTPLEGEVVGQWVNGDLVSLARSLQAMGSYDAVLLQHEYGLYGGTDGEHVLALVHGLDAPLVAVLHTVVLNPSDNQRKILESIMKTASVVVVQSRSARKRLVEVHHIDPTRVVVVPHGAAANFSPLPAQEGAKPKVLTWGLLGPGKGIEHGLRAVARLREQDLDVTYVVAGQTHPKVRAMSGEAYREDLVGLSVELGVPDLVHFDGSYRDWGTLRALVRSADVVLLPYDSTDQVSSGVLVEALASARPVVATRFPHAEELLSGGAGLTVPHGDIAAISEALESVLFKPGVAEAMAEVAYKEAQELLWPAVGNSYRALVDEVVDAKRAG